MKKRKFVFTVIYNILIFNFLIFNISDLNVYAASNPYNEKIKLCDECYDITNCTWFAWKMASEKGGVNLPGFGGNAKNWYTEAKKNGFEVGSEPRNNSIVVWPTWTQWGHVGYVERVDGDTMYVWHSAETCTVENEEYKACIKADEDAGLLCEETYKKCNPLKTQIPCEMSISSGWPIEGFIYLDTPRNINNTNNSENVNETKKEEVKKSANNKLSELIIENIDFEFDKDTLEYNLEVDYKTKNIHIDAKAEDETALVEVEDNYELNVGENIIKITVTAEDESALDYILNINRQEEIKKVSKKHKDKKDNKKNIKKSNKILIYSIVVGIVLLIFIIGVIVFIILRKRKKNKK